MSRTAHDAVSLIGVRRAAAILGVSTATIKRKAASGAIPTVGNLDETGVYLFDRYAIEALAAGDDGAAA